jgi:uncharacterized protein (DUF885 family)
MANLRSGLRRSYALPRILIEEMEPVLAALGKDTPENVFYQPIQSLPATLEDGARRRLSDAITAGVRNDILPAYRTLHDFLRDEYLPRARTSVGLSALPLGKSWYAFLVKRETGTVQTPAELHAFGLAEVARLRARLQSLPQEVHPAIATPEELLAFYREFESQVAAAMPSLFSQTVQADFAIRRVERFREPSAPALVYQRASRNGVTPAVLYVNAAGVPAQPVPAAAGFLREALPGHHYQLALQQERTDLPRFRRFGGEPAFVAGFGSYAESLGEELGLRPDIESKFAVLLGEIDCAARLVIDTGLHAQGWTRQQAIDYLSAQLPFDAAGASDRVDRDLALPGEVLGCTVGERKVRALRGRAEQALGARFDVRAFHAELLRDGAMPLDILESKIDRWLDALR